MTVILDKKLLEKLANKKGKTVKYIGEQITKKGSKLGISSQASLVLFLKAEGIPSTVYERKLNSDIKGEIRAHLELSNSSVTTKSFSKTSKTKVYNEKVLKIESLIIKEKIPLVSQKIIQDAYNNAEVYQVLFVFENSIRNFIATVLEKKFGADWWLADTGHSNAPVVSKDIKEEVAKRVETDKINSFHGSRSDKAIIYADFKDLGKIIQTNPAIFKPYFKGVTSGIGFLTHMLDVLALSRNNIAHMVNLEKNDRGRFLMNVNDWHNLLDTIISRL
jgi:hypothetical protein